MYHHDNKDNVLDLLWLALRTVHEHERKQRETLSNQDSGGILKYSPCDHHLNLDVLALPWLDLQRLSRSFVHHWNQARTPHCGSIVVMNTVREHLLCNDAHPRYFVHFDFTIFGSSDNGSLNCRIFGVLQYAYWRKMNQIRSASGWMNDRTNLHWWLAMKSESYREHNALA